MYVDNWDIDKFNRISFPYNLLSAGERKNPFNFSIDIDFLRTFGIKFKLKTFKC